MAHKKGVGSSRNGRDSNPQYRGVKKFGGEKVVAGNLIRVPHDPLIERMNVASQEHATETRYPCSMCSVT